MAPYTPHVTPTPLFCLAGPEGHNKRLFIDTEYIVESCAATGEQVSIACELIAAVLDQCHCCPERIAAEAAAIPGMVQAMERLLTRAAFRCGITAVDFAAGIDLEGPSIALRRAALIRLAAKWEPFPTKMMLCGPDCGTCTRLGYRWQHWLGTHQH